MQCCTVLPVKIFRVSSVFRILWPESSVLHHTVVHLVPFYAPLHWLPVKHRITYKVATLTFKALLHRQPTYLCQLLNTYSQLISCDHRVLVCWRSRKLPSKQLTGHSPLQQQQLGTVFPELSEQRAPPHSSLVF